MNNIELDGSMAVEDRSRRRDRVKSRQSIHSISWKWPFLLLALGCALLYLVHLIDYKLPSVVTEREALENPLLFSGERSRKHLEKLVAIGERVVGSRENEVLAPELLLEELKNIKNATHSAQSLRFDLQTGSGDYNLGFKPPFTNAYVNVNNVIAKLDGYDDNHSILLNCHYDSVTSSVGASDDAVSCAIMLEILTVLSQSKTRLKHNLVFLFNGAEETPLMAAHLFLKHDWSKTVRAFLNLEAGGVGGRAILFQSGPKNSWLLNYYAKYAPHPHGQIFGEELFQSGAVPSDTDFRIFRDFGNLPGLDFAFSRNGYLYHTIYDRSEYIETGSIQHSGDNLLAVLRELGNAPELEDKERNNGGELVYMDYLGWFMICYSKTAGIFINLLVVLLSLLSVAIFTGRLSQWTWFPDGFHHVILRKLRRGRLREAQDDLGTTHATTELKQTHASMASLYSEAQVYKEVGFSMAGIMCGMVACVLTNALMGLIVDSVSAYSMPFYSKTYLIFPLYWIPGFVAYVLPMVLMDNWREKKRGLSLSLTCQLNLVSAHLPFTILLFLLTCAGIRSASVIMINVLFSAMANFTIHITQLYRSVHRWIWVYLVLHIPALMVQLYCVLLLYALFIPIMGRSGPSNADLFVSVITAVLVIYSTTFALPLFTLVRRKGLVIVLLFVASLATILLCIFSSVGLPYKEGPSNPAPQRYWIMHTARTFYNETMDVRREDSGYFILNLDRNSPHTIPRHLREDIRSMKSDCEEELLCGAPLFTSRMTIVSSSSSWIPAPPPKIPVNTEINLIDKSCTNAQCSIQFKIKGPDRKSIFISPKSTATLAEWSFSAPVMSALTHNNRPVYFVSVVSGNVTEDFQLNLKLNVTEENQSLPILDVTLVGNHVHHSEERTAEYKKFIGDFPKYVTMTGWISSVKAYIF